MTATVPIKMMSKGLLLCLLIATAWAYPQESDYDDYEYEEEVEEYGDLPEFAFESQSLVAKVGETVNIPCQITENSPFVLLVKKAATSDAKDKLIFVGNVKVQRDRRYKFDNNQLEISNLRASDSGTYVCRLESQPSPIELHHFLDVQYPPKVEAVSPPEHHVRKGDNVQLECKAEGNPQPVISWSRLEGRLPSGAQHEEGESMTLADVDRHVEGTYTCTADNGIGEPATASMSVIVDYEPEIITEKAIIRSGEGDTVELVCIVHARPSPTVNWTLNGMPVDLDAHAEEKDGGHRHSLRISQVTEEDFGDYVCTAHNDLGTVTGSIHMTGLPKPPHFTSDPNGGEENSYTLTWETESYYPIESYRLKYRKAKANDSTDEPGEWSEMTYDASDVETNGLMHTMKHTIEDLEPATDYHANVQIKNQFMWGENQQFAFSTRKVSPTTTTTPTFTTTPTTTTTTTFPTTTFVEDKVGPTSGSVQEVAGQQSTLSGSGSVGLNALLLLLSVFLLRT